MTILRLRSMMGIGQGVLLYLLYNAFTAAKWPATVPQLFVPLVMVALFVPLLVTLSVSNLRLHTLRCWGSGVAGLLVIIGFYAVYREMEPGISAHQLSLLPVGLIFLTAIALFVAQSLIASGDHDKQWLAHYPTYFDVAWKLSIQLLFAFGFTLLFWILLWIGGGLFAFIHLNFFSDIIEDSRFAFPATTVAIAIALHITDVNVGIVRGIRTLALVLLAWLLPILTFIISLFLISLCFTGLNVLWQTGSSAALLLSTTILLIILINVVYQDGQRDERVPMLQRYAATLSCYLLAPLILLSIYALYLRVHQYGWTPSRIDAAICMLIVVSYALGYIIAASRRTAWLKTLEVWNIGTAFLALLLYLAISTPIADPARLMVNSQIARLEAGVVTADKFDFTILRTRGKRYGREALLQLQQNRANASDIRKLATAALALPAEANGIPTSQPKQKKENVIHVRTPNAKLPSSFLGQDWKNNYDYYPLPTCLTNGYRPCDAWIMRDTQQKELIIILDSLSLIGFQQDAKGQWMVMGSWQIPVKCSDEVRNALATETFKMVAPDPSHRDIEVKGIRLNFAPRVNDCHLNP